MSIHASGRVYRNSIGKLVACFGVDVQGSIPTPGAEIGRVDVGAGCCPAEAAHLLFGLLGFDTPGAVGGRKAVAVFHDSPRRVVVLESVPDHAGDLPLFHGNAFRDDE